MNESWVLSWMFSCLLQSRAVGCLRITCLWGSDSQCLFIGPRRKQSGSFLEQQCPVVFAVFAFQVFRAL